MKRAVALLGQEEVQDIIQNEGKIEVRCCAYVILMEHQAFQAASQNVYKSGHQPDAFKVSLLCRCHVCEFCRETYQFGESEVLALLESNGS